MTVNLANPFTIAAIGTTPAFSLKTFAPRFEKAAAVCAAALLFVSMAMPEDNSAAPMQRAASAVPGVPITAFGQETAFGTYLGAPYHYPSDFKLVKPGHSDLTIKNVEWFTHPFENPLYYGARLQRWFRGGVFGSMIDFTHSKAYAPMQQNAKFEGKLDDKAAPKSGNIDMLFNKLEFSHGHNMLTLNGLVRFGAFSKFLVPYAGVGAGISLPHTELQTRTEEARTYEYQFAGPVAQAVAGLELRLSTGSVFVEYKFTFADYRAPHTRLDGSLFPLDMWRQFTRWWRGEEPAGGWAETRLSSHQVIGGFLVRFAPAAGAAPQK